MWALLRKIFNGIVRDGKIDFIQDHHKRPRDIYSGILLWWGAETGLNANNEYSTDK